MKLIIEAEAKEIADLVVALQDRQKESAIHPGGENPISQYEATFRQILDDIRSNPDRVNASPIVLELPSEWKATRKSQSH